MGWKAARTALDKSDTWRHHCPVPPPPAPTLPVQTVQGWVACALRLKVLCVACVGGGSSRQGNASRNPHQQAGQDVLLPIYRLVVHRRAEGRCRGAGEKVQRQRRQGKKQGVQSSRGRRPARNRRHRQQLRPSGLCQLAKPRLSQGRRHAPAPPQHPAAPRWGPCSGSERRSSGAARLGARRRPPRLPPPY